MAAPMNIPEDFRKLARRLGPLVSLAIDLFVRRVLDRLNLPPVPYAGLPQFPKLGEQPKIDVPTKAPQSVPGRQGQPPYPAGGNPINPRLSEPTMLARGQDGVVRRIPISRFDPKTMTSEPRGPGGQFKGPGQTAPSQQLPGEARERRFSIPGLSPLINLAKTIREIAQKRYLGAPFFAGAGFSVELIRQAATRFSDETLTARTGRTARERVIANYVQRGELIATNDPEVFLVARPVEALPANQRPEVANTVTGPARDC